MLKIIFICLFFLCACVLFQISCTSETRNNTDAKQIIFSFSDQLEKQSDYFKVVDVIPLETNDSSLIGYMSDVICKPSGFYVLDNKSSKQIIKFDKNGKFLYAVNKSGRGPGEYIKLREICVDTKDKFLYLYDSTQKRIICYDSSNGKYIKYFKINFTPYSFSVLPDNNHFLFYCSYIENQKLKKEDTYPQFVVTDSIGQIKKTFAYFDEKINSQNVITIGNVFALTDSVLYFFNQYDDAIFRINNNLDVSYEYLIDYLNNNQSGNKELLEKIRNYSSVDFVRNSEVRKQSQIYELSGINFTDRFIYCKGSYSLEKSYYYLYNKVSRNSVDLTKLEADVIGQDLYFMDADSKCFYAPVPVGVLKRSINRRAEDYSPKIVDVVKNLDDNANPVIIKIEMPNTPDL